MFFRRKSTELHFRNLSRCGSDLKVKLLGEFWEDHTSDCVVIRFGAVDGVDRFQRGCADFKKDVMGVFLLPPSIMGLIAIKATTILIYLLFHYYNRC